MIVSSRYFLAMPKNTKRGADGSPFCFAVSSQKVRCKA
jgi:hypothetical protein